MPLIDRYIDSQVSVITLNNSENGNLLNLDTLTEFKRAFNGSYMNRDVRVILLRSDGKTFCHGMDLVQLQVLNRSREEVKKEVEMAVSLYVELLYSIHTSPQPVICLLSGEVKAGGVGLACACDIILSTEDTTFELSEVLFGLIPANVLPYLLSLRITPQKARYLVLTSKRISADEAYRLNLVDELFPENEFERGVRNIIKKLLRSSPSALAESKAFTQALRGKDIFKAGRMGKEKLIELIQRSEVIEAITSFNDGNVPEWFDRYRPEKPLHSPSGETDA